MATEITDKSAQLVLFEAIETALEDSITDKTINSVEIFNSQTDFENKERPHLYPYVAVNISVEWKKIAVKNNQGYTSGMLQNQQEGLATVTVYVIFENLYDETVSFKEAEPVRHCVHRAINLLQDDNYFTYLMRIGSDLDSSHDRVFTFPMVYQCGIVESAMKDETKQVVTDVEPVLDTDLIIDNDIIRTAKEFP